MKPDINPKQIVRRTVALNALFLTYILYAFWLLLELGFA